MYAIEEYGKAEILRDHLTNRSIPGWVFGRKNTSNHPNSHDEKILKALEKSCSHSYAFVMPLQSEQEDCSNELILDIGVRNCMLYY